MELKGVAYLIPSTKAPVSRRKGIEWPRNGIQYGYNGGLRPSLELRSAFAACKFVRRYVDDSRTARAPLSQADQYCWNEWVRISKPWESMFCVLLDI